MSDHPQRADSLTEAAREGYAHERPAVESEDGRSLGAVFRDLTQNVSTLMRQEVALAKAEVSESATKAGKGVGMFVGAAIAGFLLLVFISVSAWWGLGQFIENQWSALVVAGVWAIIAVALALAGRAELRRIRGVPRTAETLGKVPNALKGQEEENR